MSLHSSTSDPEEDFCGMSGWAQIQKMNFNFICYMYTLDPNHVLQNWRNFY